MNKSSKYYYGDYKSLQLNVQMALSIILFAVIGFDVILIVVTPNWMMKLCLAPYILLGITSVYLLNKVYSRLVEERDVFMMFQWVASYLLMVLASLPIALFIYLNLDWELLIKYGFTILSMYWQRENAILPIAVLLLISLTFWTLTIQLYKSSYNSYLHFNKKKEIYEK